MTGFGVIVAAISSIVAIHSSDASAVSAPPLSFSWDTVPVFFETSNVTGPFDDEALHTFARAHILVVEKAYDWPNKTAFTEDKIRDIGAKLRAINRNISLFYYLNTNLDIPGYRINEQMMSHHDWLLRYPDGSLATCPVDSGAGATPPFPFTELNIYDHRAPGVSDAWVADCINMTRGPPHFAGCVVDRWTRTPKTTKKLDPKVLAEWATARNKTNMALINALKTDNKYLFSCGDFNNETDGGLNPGFGHQLNVKALQQMGRDGKGALCSYKPGSVGAEFESQLAAFLIAASEYQYFGAGSWTTDHSHREGATWHEEYSKPLGKPLGEATTKPDGTLVRKFAAGTIVTFNERSKIGSISWGSAEV